MADLDPKKIPQHIAIIMDGNGRWAKERFLPRIAGHKEGAEALRRTIMACVEFGVKYLSVYAFSTENWTRPQDEVSFLMGFFKDLIGREIPELKKQGVRIRVLGDLVQLSQELQKSIAFAETQTASNTALNVNLMINYGSRREIVQAVQRIVDKGLRTVDESTISDNLYTAGIPDPEILLRPSGEFRLSNFMLWQISYSELIFLKRLWPDFNRDEFIGVLQQFQKRDRRFGGVAGK
jgi:undecaprenyl diphosphate synthase